ncbi:MAG: haloacid dehalogenase-like hydrolase [Oscillospiraceae bacterium]|jgi:phosphoserine phosphatase|nr:haloacid dehalogenase-like hydrolase [Oscillospiraceae bacterium]
MMPNVYDFDKTVVYPDSTAAFYRFCLRRHPKLLRRAPEQLRALVRYYAGVITKTHAKADFYAFLRDLPDWRAEVALFWRRKGPAMLKPWYLLQKRPDDIIVSASPEFLLRPVCRQLGVRLVASRVDPATGVTEGENCHGQEKVRRLRETFGNVGIDEFYSDARSDEPLARLAKRAFLVKGDRRIPWDGN